MPALPPFDEEERLQELFSYGVLDAPPEPAFDRVTRLVTRMLHTPVAYLSFFDQDRVWVKSAVGIPLCEAERARSFCARLPAEGGVLVIPDIRQDPTLSEISAEGNYPQVRFFAGASLVSPGGRLLGALCVLDNRPRTLESEQISLLGDLAALALDELALRQARQRCAVTVDTNVPPDEVWFRLRDDLQARVDHRMSLLMNADARYRSIFENAVDGMYQTLPNGRFLNVNPALAHLLGYTSPATLMEAVPDVGLLYVADGRRAEFCARMEYDGSVNHWESEFYRANGTRIWVSENARAIRDTGGLLLRYEGTAEDITTRRLAEDAIQRANEDLEARVRSRTAELALLNGTLRQQVAEKEAAEANARRSETKFRALIENALDLITILTPDGTVLYQSPSVQHVLGVDPEDAGGRNLFRSKLVHPDDEQPFRALLEQFIDGTSRNVRSEFRLRHQDGSWRLLESIGSALPSDSPVIGVIINSRDITERRRTELEHQARTRQQTAIAELGRCALGGHELQMIFNQAVELMSRALEVTLTTITEVTPDPCHLLVRAGTGWEAGTLGNALVSNWRECEGGGASYNEPLVMDDLRLRPDHKVVVRVPGGEEPRSAVSVVIWGDDKPFGTLCAMSPEAHRFTPSDVTFLQTTADMLSTILRSKHHEAASREIDARYQRISANTPGMVFQYNVHPDGTPEIPFVSEGCRLIYDVEPADLQAEPRLLGRLVHPEDKENYKRILNHSFETLTPFRWEGRVALPSGKVRWVTARSRPERQPNGDVIWDGVVMDVSDLKLAEQAMLAAKEEAERANAAKSEFLSRMSHELRTPLNAILGFGQLLGLERLTPMQTSSVEQILQGGHHLLKLINEVLDISRIEAGSLEMTLESIDVRVVLDEALRFAAPLGEQRRVRFIDRGPQSGLIGVLADRARLHQVLLNLLSNAIKYNHDDGEVRVGARSTGSGHVRISVSDTGPGIESSKLELVFAPFQRLDAPQWGIEGTGIGLTITKSLVEAMGGTIGVESSPRRGSTFFVDLPAATLAEPEGGSGQAAAGGSSAASASSNIGRLLGTRTILHVDDQPANLAVVQRVIETRTELRLLSAASGQEAISVARTELPDLILLDLHLPDLDGTEVVRRLRSDARTRKLYIFVVSADVTPAQGERLRQLGVRGFLTKPLRVRELLELVDTAFTSPPQPAPTVT